MDRIFYSSPLIRDPLTNYPIYIFDTSYLPPTESIDYDTLIPVLVQKLPSRPYVLVMFSSGLNKISWVWGLKFVKSFMSNAINLNNLVKIFTVHDSWFIKSVTSVIHNYHTTKHNIGAINYMLDAFAIQPKGQRHTDVVHCRTLSELSHYLNITLLKISLNIFKYDLQLENELSLSFKVPPVINPHVLLSPQTNPAFYHHVYQLLNIIHTHCCKKELIFYAPGKRENIDILYQCIKRNQLVWINDWDLYCIATVFKKILSDLPFALIPYKFILLPIQDDFEYTQAIFNAIITSHQQYTKTINYDQLLLQIFQIFSVLVSNEELTKHNTTTIAKSMAHCLSHEIVSTNTSHVLVVQRFIKNVLQYWDEVKISYDFPSITEVLSGKIQSNNMELTYEMSYEVTYDDEDEDEEGSNFENQVLFNTSNILDPNSDLQLDECKNDQLHFDRENRLGRMGSRKGSDNVENLVDNVLSKPPRPPPRTNSTTNRDLSPSKTRQPKSMPPPPPPTPPPATTSTHIPTSRLFKKEEALTLLPLDISDETHHNSNTTTSEVSTRPKEHYDSITNDENVAPESVFHGNHQLLHPPPRSPRSAKSTSTTLSNVSNLQLQFPPQKYHFTKPKSTTRVTTGAIVSANAATTTSDTSHVNPQGQVDLELQDSATASSLQKKKKKPVIRGRKVSQLAKLFEERSQGLEILNSM
ncbi:ECM25 [Candida theae]|uniref:ECM25 n=1 Tax=Candida theae TaxID=1198502 RepID=A0AAD5BAF0_9ASCO|nr:ECM25 [Candida theae]KAI5948876.1 ECM25 [Candida theae]